jgi:hypothetical protein
MDFLDNLENSLKNLEQQQERDPNAAARQIEARRLASEIAPWADALKTSAYVQSLFEKAAVAGHRLRSKIYMAWLENTLRLEAKGRWCEIRPTPGGIQYEFVSADGSTVTEPLDLSSDPNTLLGRWLGEGAVPEPASGA